MQPVIYSSIEMGGCGQIALLRCHEFQMCLDFVMVCVTSLFVDDSIIRLRSIDFNVNPKWMKSIYIRLSQYPIP